MRQKSKFIILITLICFISLLFLPVKVWSVNPSDAGGAGSCIEVCARMEYEMVDYGYGPFWKYSCVEYYPLPAYCFEPSPTSPPATSPPATSPPATSPPATSPPATSPPATSPPATSPPATSPPSNGGCEEEETPPATSPPATSPSATLPPATSPPATSPSATSPPSGGSPPVWTPPVSPPPTLPATEPCMIHYFELPERAWVGYPITGKWSASAWCDDCDVDCTPYPACVWKQDSIGTGFDEYKFTLSQSGTYNYTLTCYGPGGIDQRTEIATVEALNLPWWREIIPVLPGFLRGIFR